MKYIFLIALSFGLLISNLSQAQIKCGIDDNLEHRRFLLSLPFETRTSFSKPENNHKVPMQFHIVSANGGEVIKLKVILDALCYLNEVFDTIGLTFYMGGNVNYITNPTFSSLPNMAVGDAMVATHNVPGRMNVYFTKLNNFSPGALCGFGNFPFTGGGSGANAGAIVLDAGCVPAPNPTWAHEMGHHLSLFHTFQTTSSNPTGASAERVTRVTEVNPRVSANCATAADLFCDTEADYLQGGWTSCNMVHTTTDFNGDVFRPESANFMSYSLDQCQNKFSQQQKGTMVYSMVNLRSQLINQNHPTFNPIASTINRLTPAQGSTNNPANFTFFSWNKVPGATHYILEFSRFSSFTPGQTFDTLITDTMLLYEGTRIGQGNLHYWRVRPFSYTEPCTNFSSVGSFTASAPYGVNTSNLVKKQEIKVYPSLVSRNSPLLTINYAGAENKTTIFQIMNVNGKIIQQEELNLNSSSITQIHLLQNQAGVYFVNIKDAQTSFVQKIVIY